MPIPALLPRSLKFRMTGVVVLLVLIATISVTSVSLILAERNMQSVIGDQQYALLSSSAAHIDSQLVARRTLLASLAETMPPDMANDPMRLGAFFDLHSTARQQFLSLLVFDRKGALQYRTLDNGPHSDITASDREYFKQTLATKGSVISQPFRSRASGLPVILITQPVLDAQGEVTMVLAGSIDLLHADFLEQISAQKPGKTGYIFIMTSRGTLVLHPDQKRLLTNINDRPGRNRATEMALQGFEGWTEAVNKDAIDCIYSYKHIKTTDWIVAARYPVDEAFAPMIAMRRHARQRGGGQRGVAGLVTWLAIMALLRPLSRLQRRIGDIRKGRAEIGVLLLSRQDEIGELSNAFHVLMAQREAAQDSIRDSESLISNILERAPDAFVSCDTTGIITNWNAAAETTFGWSRAEALGRDIAELIIPPGQRDAHHRGIRQFARSGSGPLINARVRVNALHRDGHEIPVELSLGALRHGGEYYATAFLHNITERVLYEQQLAASERRARMIADSMPAVIAYIDRDLRYRFTNEHVRELLGKNPEELLGQSIAEAFGQAFADMLAPYHQAALRGERVHYEREGEHGGRQLQLMVDLIPDLASDGSVPGYYMMALDITERKNAELAQAASQKRLQLLTDNLPALILYITREHTFQFVNATFFHWFGVAPEKLIGRHLTEGLGQEQYRNALPYLEQAYRGKIVTYELRAAINGSTHTLETTFVPEIGPDGDVVGLYSLTHDTTRMKEIEERLTQLARIDTLTGIANRLMFEEILQLAMARAKRNRQPMALAYLDVDHFKRINDTLGHGAGDAVLKQFASRLVANVRATDTVARLAGDEFVIVFEQVHNAGEAARLAAKIVDAMRLPFMVEGSELAVTTSVGVALHLAGDEGSADLVARADRALYEAKRKGRNGYATA